MQVYCCQCENRVRKEYLFSQFDVPIPENDNILLFLSNNFN